VIYPPVFTEDIAVRFSKRNKMILSVGRFSSYQSVKKQNVLIQAFKFACNKGLYDGYELVLAGGLSQSDNKFFSDLQMSARSYPIRFLPNISRKELVTLYQESGVYWHAAGFGETDPALMEHFGISTVEAMASGCIPVTYQAGGQMEIIRDGQNGFFWTNQDQLLERTKQIIEGGTAILNMRKCASKDAHAFNVAEFIKNWNRVLGEK